MRYACFEPENPWPEDDVALEFLGLFGLFGFRRHVLRSERAGAEPEEGTVEGELYRGADGRGAERPARRPHRAVRLRAIFDGSEFAFQFVGRPQVKKWKKGASAVWRQSRRERGNSHRACII